MVAYQNGDDAGLEGIWYRQSGRVYHYLKKKVSDEVAKELTQEVFLKLHNSRNLYKSQYPFLPWLFTIAQNILIDHFRRAESKVMNATIHNPDIVELIPSPIPLEGSLFEDSLSNLMRSLPEAQRNIIERRYRDEWSFEQIAREMKSSPVNIRQILSRSIKKLKILKGDSNEF